MTDFLSSSSCRGIRPRRLGSVRIHSRPDLIAKLMRERHVARFLVAPGGFGKSSLACAYAETVFSFDHVFWFDGKSPCFLRDLDKGGFAEAVLARDPQAHLVVFDDVPRIDSSRADALSEAIDTLLAASCEVITTLVPSADAYARRQPDRIRLGAADLMLDETEVTLASSVGRGAVSPAEEDPLAARVPVLAWGGEDRFGVLLGGLVQEELPDGLMLGVVTLLALVNGNLEQAARIAPACQPDAVTALAAQYPYLGIDAAGGEFSAVRIPAATLARRIAPRLDALAAEASCEGKDGLVLQLADALMAAGDAERACSVAYAAATRPACAAWLGTRGCDLLRSGNVVPACVLYAGLRPGRTDEGAVLRLGQSIRLSVLGDAPRALAEAARVASAPYADEGTRAAAALVVLHVGGEAERRRAIGTLERVFGCGQPGDEAWIDRSLAVLDVARPLTWQPVASVRLCLERCPNRAVSVWEAWCSFGVSPDALCLAAALLLRAPDVLNDEDILRLAGFVRKRLDAESAETGTVGAHLVGTARVFEAAREALPSLLPLAVHTAAAVRRAESVLQAQRAAYRRMRMEDAQRSAAVPKEATGAVVTRTVELGLPSLEVRLLGGLDVQVGNVSVDPDLFRRQKVKTLLALLVVNGGRELPRDRLVEDLWPASPIDTARRNLYTVWSQLRRALTTADGQCPYLIRMQNGYKLDDRTLASDVRRVDALCRTLLIGQGDTRSWSELLNELNDAYAGDLLPSETSNETILRLRDEYRSRVVDALVAASSRLADEGEAQGSLWYARAAFERERAREDVYAALMRAQILSGQRTLALDTYFACRRFLADELGIDPAVSTVRLYRSIIEEEEALDW